MELVYIFQEGYTAINDNIFMPKEFFVYDKVLEVIFDSGCTIAMSSSKEHSIGEIQPVSKIMQGLDSIGEVVGRINSMDFQR